jgi:hypothetical protein
LTALGSPVALESHTGYAGGLDIRANKSGRTRVYVADFTNEVMFHAAPLLPTDRTDEQQVFKKKHIGNDHVHIVWCEGGEDYMPSTITSQFNLAHMIVYPGPCGLFRVEVRRRKGVGWFGPLRWGIVVRKKGLPSLVRATAVSIMDQLDWAKAPFLYQHGELVRKSKEIIGALAGPKSAYEALEIAMGMP